MRQLIRRYRQCMHAETVRLPNLPVQNKPTSRSRWRFRRCIYRHRCVPPGMMFHAGLLWRYHTLSVWRVITVKIFLFAFLMALWYLAPLGRDNVLFLIWLIIIVANMKQNIFIDTMWQNELFIRFGTHVFGDIIDYVTHFFLSIYYFLFTYQILL